MKEKTICPKSTSGAHNWIENDGSASKEAFPFMGNRATTWDFVYCLWCGIIDDSNERGE